MVNSPEIQAQVHAARERGGLLMRADRAVIEITGRDRAAWLHNLVTNTVNTLSPGEGNYTFATNVKGRCVFDAGLLMLDDRIWLDLDRHWLDLAHKHLERYIITEDVTLTRREDAVRFAAIGPAAAPFAARIGCGNLAAMAQWQHAAATIRSVAGRVARNDFLGLAAADVYLMGAGATEAAGAAQSLATELGLVEIGRDAAEILRIEAGIPASVQDIDETVVPPETGRIEQGISYHKGCYLGQEVIERMRAHNVLARKLVGLVVEADSPPPRGAAIAREGIEIGNVTSACWSETLAAPLALGYVKSAHTTPGTALVVRGATGEANAEIVSLPAKPT
ncbi:MAG: hypothetical protein HRU71_09360 [Planctomycetia bacterium]|nr:MAG: hypothetical protein HRU71_09360 [Planctomycetia bacterium]RIK69487.1 MAG: hypothetical protein DCC66_08990 [Planctomycetota bacterium]